MDNNSTIGTYGQTEYSANTTSGGVAWAELIIKSGMLRHDDIPVFSFAPLEEIRRDLLGAGHSIEEVDSTIAGLSELPEYANSNRNTSSKG